MSVKRAHAARTGTPNDVDIERPMVEKLVLVLRQHGSVLRISKAKLQFKPATPAAQRKRKNSFQPDRWYIKRSSFRPHPQFPPNAVHARPAAHGLRLVQSTSIVECTKVRTLVPTCVARPCTKSLVDSKSSGLRQQPRTPPPPGAAGVIAPAWTPLSPALAAPLVSCCRHVSKVRNGARR